ncbi:MAG: hypothetical protein ABI239_03775 [Aquihabitans sp.]
MTTHAHPHLNVTTEHPADQFHDPPGLGRHVVIGSLIAFGLSFPLILIGAMMLGQGWQSAFALSLFASLWGGIGFGSMLGGVVYASRLDGSI